MTGEMDPSGASAIGEAAGWAAGTLTGSLATAVAIIAMAAFGLLLMSGRLPRRRGLKLIVGCFIIFGAPSIAAGIIRARVVDEAPPAGGILQPSPLAITPLAGRRPISSEPYDPYAGSAVQPRR